MPSLPNKSQKKQAQKMSNPEINFHRKHWITFQVLPTDVWACSIVEVFNTDVLAPIVRNSWSIGDNRVLTYCAGYRRTTQVPSVALYIEFEFPIQATAVAAEWGDRKRNARAGTVYDVKASFQFDGRIQNMSPCGPLGPLISTRQRDRTDAFARVPIAMLCTKCGTAHASPCGGFQCNGDDGACSEVPGAMPPNMLACLSCSTAFCSRRCSENHTCGTAFHGAMLPLNTVIALKRSPAPFHDSPPDVRSMFPSYQFGVVLEEVGKSVRVTAENLEPMAERLCKTLGQYVTFTVCADNKPGITFAFAARATYNRVERLVSTASLSAMLATASSEAVAVATARKQEHLQDALAEVRADLAGVSGPKDGTVPLCYSEVATLYAAISAHAGDDAATPALCVAVTSLFTATLASVVQRQFLLALHTPAWGRTAPERVGIVCKHVFKQPGNRGLKRLFEVSQHLLQSFSRA